MNVTYSEMEKILKFLSANNKEFDSKILFKLPEENVQNKIFKLPKEIKRQIIYTFINCYNKGFDENTPSFILEHHQCCIEAIKRDLNSIHYINTTLTLEEQEEVIAKALTELYILNDKTPRFMLRNYKVAKNSVILDPFSINYVGFRYMKDKEIYSLIDLILNTEYYITEKTPDIIREHDEIVRLSLKNNVESINSIFKDFASFEYKPSLLLLDKQILNLYLEKLKTYWNASSNFTNELKDVITDIFNSELNFSLIYEIHDIVSEREWQNYCEENDNLYTNIFMRITNGLRRNTEFDFIKQNMPFLSPMKETLEDKYITLEKTMLDYYNVYRSNDNDNENWKKIQAYADIISELSSLYLAKSKENYKKELLDNWISLISEYFKLNFDNKYVNKKIFEVRKRKRFKELYESADGIVIEFINNLKHKYSDCFSIDTLDEIIDEIIIKDCNNYPLGKFPDKYNQFLTYEKVQKLINRLNSNYISIDGVEVEPYKHLIEYNQNTNNYFYNGELFTEEELKRIYKYKKELYVFNQIKKEIILKIKEQEIDVDIEPYEIENLKQELPFNEENFVLDKKLILDKFGCDDFFHYFIEIFDDVQIDLKNEEIKKNFYEVFVNKGFCWLLFILHLECEYFYITNTGDMEYFFKVVKNMQKIKQLSNNETNLKTLIWFNDILNLANITSISILGTDTVYKLATNRAYTSHRIDKIIDMAADLACSMSKREKSTVPYIKGSYMDYQYSMYDSQDNSVLFCGIDTNACFKVGGNDNDFLHYCCLDKNGFVIKITDKTGKFIGRASGFRNGNSVFINQLRTIYEHEKKPYFYNPNDVIETLKCACKDIINTSQKNKKEKIKIDNVFITNGYLMRNVEPKVGAKTLVKIGKYPMENKSVDWKEFVNNTKNLSESHHGYFYTDYDYRNVILVASSKKRLKPKRVKKQDVPALYERKRNEVIITSNPDIQTLEKINKIRGIKNHLENNPLASINVLDNFTVLVGDNWYIIEKDGNITEKCVLEFDEQAVEEYSKAVNNIESNKVKKLTFSNSNSRI